MARRLYIAIGIMAVVAMTIACSRQESSAVSPSTTTPTSSDAATDGAALKVSVPTPTSPINNVVTSTNTPTLVANPASGTYVPTSLAYDFEVYDENNVKVRTLVVSAPNWVVPDLDFNRPYTWRVRGTSSNAFGPWSAFASFRTPDNEGYIRGNELYDPLINGRTVGTIVGPAHFVPGVGISLDALDSYVQYQLQQTLVEGEFSMLATNVRTRTEGGKTKVMAMTEGFDDITTNNRRLTFEKRSDGTMAWRMITHDDQIDTGSAERLFVQFNLTDTFFFGLDWHSNVLTPSVRRGGANGPIMYTLPKPWNGRPYDPDPHIVYIGGPGGRAGADSGTVPNIIIRQVWVSPRSRPASIAQ